MKKTTELTLQYIFDDTHKLTYETGDNLEDAINDYWWNLDDYYEEGTFPTTDELDPDNWEVIDWSEVNSYGNLQNIDLLNEIANENIAQDWDVISAAIACDIQIDNIDDAYCGEYRDDEDFAYETAASLGYLGKNISWPYTCIDWEMAARELMYDYTEDSGYYFRNL